MTSLIGESILDIANKLVDMKKGGGDHLVRSYSSSPSSCDHSGGVYEESHPTATNAFVAAENRQISLNFFADNNLLCEHLNDESSAATTTSETTTTASSESPEPEPTTIDAIMTSSSTMTTDEVPTTTTTTTSPPSTPSELFDAIQRFQEQQQQRHIALFNSLAQNIGADPVTSPPSLLNFGLPLAGAAADLSTFAGDSGSSTKGVTPKRETSNPPYSPWMRNAGRKKSHPVWEFFRDLKDTQGTGGVMCLHCAWQGDDRSPNNLRTHLKKFHTDDGIFQRFSFRLSQTPTQPYVKRARAGGNNNNSQQERTTADSLASAMQQLQQSGHLGTYNTSLNFLDNLPKSNEVINIGAGFIKDDDEDNHNTEAGSSTASEEQHLSTSPLRDEAVASPHVSASANSLGSLGDDSQANNNNQFAAFMNIAAANPMMLAMLGSAANVMNATTTTTATSSGATTCVSASASTSPPSPPHLPNASNGVPFTLSEGSCASVLMSMAVDLDMTLSYHRRRVDVELCFESNRTAEKSGGRGKIICLTDLGKEIRITERINGAVVDTEMWTKTDFNQFHWAIRGKCQKAFIKA